MMRRLVLAVGGFPFSISLFLAPAVPAQDALYAVVPDAWATTQGPDNNSYPFNYFSGGPGRYQQVYAASDFAAGGVTFPIQITEIGFRPGLASNGSYVLSGRDLTVTITLSASAAGPDLLATTFAANAASPPALVYSGLLTFPTVPAIPGPGPFPWSWIVPLQSPFVYDGSADLLLDVTITSLLVTNPLSPVAPLDAVNAAGDPVSRLFHTSNPSATTGVADSVGLITRFGYDPAGFNPFGSGCAGGGGLVPAIGSVGGLPTVGNLGFAVTLSNAPPGSPGSFLLGASTTSWLGIPLPWELLPFGAPGCFLLVSADVIIPVTTSGSGTSAVGVPIPPIPGLAGSSAHMQWALFDFGVGHPIVSDGGTATIS